MPRIYVEFAKLKQQGDKCKTIASKVDRVNSDFQHTVSQLDWDVKYMSDINNTAKQLAQKLTRFTQALQGYQNFINDTYDKYVKLDNEKFDEHLLNTNPSSGKDDNVWLDWLWDSVGEAGILGSVVSFGKSIYDLLNGNGNIGKSVSSILKSFADLASDVFDLSEVAKSIGKAKEILTQDTIIASWADEILGISPLGSSASGNFLVDWVNRIGNFGDNFSDALKNSLDDLVGGTSKSIGKTVTQWAGIVFSGAVNYFDNVEEFGGHTWRGAGETLVETGVDVVMGLVVGAAVTALAPVSAPALAIAAVSVGVVVGLNAVSTAVFNGNDIGENIANGAFWVGGKIVDGAKAIGTAIGDTIANWFSNPIFSW